MGIALSGAALAYGTISYIIRLHHLSANLLGSAENVFGIICSYHELGVLDRLRSAATQLWPELGGFTASGAHAHGDITDHEDKGDGENSKEDNQVLDCVCHADAFLLIGNNLGLGDDCSCRSISILLIITAVVARI